jgi:GTP-binding protein EngB required for normal cell division
MRNLWTRGHTRVHDMVQERLAARKYMDLPEIAVVGRTNAGKSSLLNHVLGKAGAAKASSRAGKTSSIDLYLVNDSLVLADVPGILRSPYLNMYARVAISVAQHKD